MYKKRRHPGTFYFFPVFLPLAELLPWLLAVMGAVAGMAGFSFPVFWQKYKRALLSLAVLCIGLGIGIFFYMRPVREVRMEGTRLIEAAMLPVPVKTAEAVPFQPPASQTFGELWSRNTAKQVLSTPIVFGDLLIFGTLNNSIEALSRQNGAEVWSLPLKAPVFSLTQGAGDVIYGGEGLHETTSSSLTAFHAGDGKIIWQREFLGHLEETVTLDDAHHRLWVSAGPGGLWALDSRNGHVLWHQPVGHIDSRAMLLDEVIYVPADSDEKNHQTTFYAMNAATGKILWTLPQPGQPWGSPQIDKTGEIILTTTGSGQIGAAKPTDKGWAQGISKTGKLLWQVELVGMPLQPAIYLAAEDIIIHTTKSGYVVAVRGADGAVVWQANISEQFNAPATLIPGFKIPMIAVTAYDSTFSIRNAITGDELARRKVAVHTSSSPVVEGNLIYVPGPRTITVIGGLHVLGDVL